MRMIYFCPVVSNDDQPNLSALLSKLLSGFWSGLQNEKALTDVGESLFAQWFWLTGTISASLNRLVILRLREHSLFPVQWYVCRVQLLGYSPRYS